MPIISQLNYLKEIYKLETLSVPAKVSLLAKILKVSKPSVSQQLRALSHRKLISWKPRGAIALTPEGERMAIDLIRKHRIIETFLVQHLSYNPLEAHVEAEELEHLASEKFADALSQLCGSPQYDPHGDPIPNRQGVFPSPHTWLRLKDLPEGRVAEVIALSEHDKALLRSVVELKIRIGQHLQRSPNGDFLAEGRRFRFDAQQQTIIFVREAPPE